MILFPLLLLNSYSVCHYKDVVHAPKNPGELNIRPLIFKRQCQKYMGQTLQKLNRKTSTSGNRFLNFISILTGSGQNSLTERGIRQDMPGTSNFNMAVQHKHSICILYRGRLGNNMFQYASSFGIGRAKNMTIKVSKQDLLSKTFLLPSAVKVNNKQHCTHAKIISEKIHCAYDPTLYNFTDKEDVSLIDYLQSWKYFQQYDHQLRTEFTFQEEIMETAKEIFAGITQEHHLNNSTYIGVHVRRGDIAVSKSLRIQGYRIAPKSYIYKAVSFYKSRYKNATFLISTDDPLWVEKHFSKHQKLLKLHIIGKHPATIDLAVLSLCDHMIITTGTFSWWAGWLAGGTTVYYKHPVYYKSRLRKQFSENYTDYFYPQWIGLD